MSIQGEVHIREQVQVLPRREGQRASQVGHGTTEGAEFETDPGAENEEHKQGLVARGATDEDAIDELTSSSQNGVGCEGKAAAGQNEIVATSVRAGDTTRDSLSTVQG